MIYPNWVVGLRLMDSMVTKHDITTATRIPWVPCHLDGHMWSKSCNPGWLKWSIVKPHLNLEICRIKHERSARISAKIDLHSIYPIQIFNFQLLKMKFDIFLCTMPPRPSTLGISTAGKGSQVSLGLQQICWPRWTDSIWWVGVGEMFEQKVSGHHFSV